MDYRINKNTGRGGADGCINFEDPDNKGLPSCINRFKIPDVFAK